MARAVEAGRSMPEHDTPGAAMNPIPDGVVEWNLRPGHPDFGDLPWVRPVGEWRDRSGRIIEVESGLTRHAMAFAVYERAIYAFKGMPMRVARHEFAVLQGLEQRGLPTVEPVGCARVAAAAGDSDTGVLITQFLDHSLPYRTLFRTSGLARYRERLFDAMASLLVRLHLGGAYWGDCSLSNTLFRRDAGELQAFLVDAETAKLHERITDGLRRQDLMIMEENLVGELADLAQGVALPAGVSVKETGHAIRERYERLWSEITREEVFLPGEDYRIHERIRSLNDMGFTVGEVSLVPAGDGHRLRMRAIVTDRDYHRHQLHSLTGIVAGDSQAAMLLNEVHEMQATLGERLQRRVPIALAAHRWLEERYRPAAEKLTNLRTRTGDQPEIYCQVLEHKWYLSERARHDVGLDAAIADYMRRFEEG